ncbi:MAG: glycosyltransferase, partial [Halothiobacillus sp.]|nr:glycosyltransferase [Halothiobacillus sp.]
VVLGDEPRWALRQENSQCAQIQKALTDQGAINSVQFLGSTSDEELSAAYFAADVLIFPVQHKTGDSEGFGMVAIEAAAHGLPTVAFDAGGVGDAVSDGASGRLIPAGNNAAFTAAVLELLDNPLPSEKSQIFAAQFAWVQFNQKLQRHLQNSS